MNVWLIEPLDPLIARDGRPAAVGRFETVSFPYPSMLAGAVRTRMGSENGTFSLPGSALQELKEKVIVEGPLLAEIEEENGSILQWLAPAPRDAVFLQGTDGKLMLRPLAPRDPAPGEALDSLAGRGLIPVSLAGPEIEGKSPHNVPAFWSWSAFEDWLTVPEAREGAEPADFGIGALPVEKRAHLAIQPGERVGMDGMLFETAGLRFLQPRKSPLEPRRFALSLRCAEAMVAGRKLALEKQIAPLGGERRLARWSPASRPWPLLPEAVRNRIVSDRRARLILLTPAYFTLGPLPAWSGGIGPPGGPVKATVRAACVSRPVVVSGWDLSVRNANNRWGRPKPTRRLAPGGSVYFVELEGSDDDVGAWCDKTWLTCVSDDGQACRDGFGLAALGTWRDFL